MLNGTEKKIPVVFRRDKYSGEIFAVFPSLRGRGTADSYIGFTTTRGEITVEPEDLKETLTVEPLECLGVLQDSVKAGFYPLHVAQRISQTMLDARQADPRVSAIAETKEKKEHKKGFRPLHTYRRTQKVA